MLDLVRKAALAGIGVMTLTEEKARKIIDELVEQGQVSGEEGECMVKEMVSKFESSKGEIESKIKENVNEVFRKMELAPRKDLNAAEERIQQLEKRIAELEKREKDLEEDATK